LVNELYGEIRIFALPLEKKHSYEIPGIGGQRLCFFEQNMQGRKRGFERVLAFWPVCG
jgi:hypothetical protein